MTLPEPPDPDLFCKNMRAFSERHPHVHAELEKIDAASGSIIWDHGQAVNIDVGGVRLYLKDEPHWTTERREASDYYQDSVIFDSIHHTNPSTVTLPMVKKLHTFLIDRQAQTMLAPVRDAGYCFSFGLGLGLQMSDLIKDNRFHNYIIIEPVPEFILHSCHVVDWEQVFSIADDNDAHMHFIVAPGPQEICAQLVRHVFSRGNAFIEGSSFYSFYFSWALKNAYVLFKNEIKGLGGHWGFFEDEVTMVTNSVKTLRHGGYRLINGALSLEVKHPLFIVGCGPSLDQDLAHIRRLQDKALIVSCGTALGPLLGYGIKPDFHCENENVPLVADIIGDLSERHDLSGITLLATTAACEALANYFDDVWYYFRSALTSTKLWSSDYKPLEGAAPLVANAALVAAIRFGFKNLYLFGCDCGARDAAKHHSAESFYNTSDHEAARKTQQSLAGWLDRWLPGNFGGQVNSTWHLDASRQSLSQIITAHRAVSAWNCSDGAFIAGFQPTTAASLRFPELPIAKKVIVDRIGRKYPLFEAGEFFADFDADGLVGGIKRFQQRFDELMTGLIEKGQDSFRGLEDAFSNLVVDEEQTDGRSHPEWEIIISCVRSIMRSANFLGSRLVDEDLYKEYVGFSLGIIRSDILEVARQAEDVYRQVGELMNETAPV